MFLFGASYGPMLCRSLSRICPYLKEFDAAVFPWMGKTRTSKAKGSETTPEQVNPLQAYWGMPRRVRIDFEDLEEGRCDFAEKKVISCFQK